MTIHNNYIITGSGYRSDLNFTNGNFVLSPTNNTLEPVRYSHKYPVIKELFRSYKDSLNDIYFTLRCDDIILAAQDISGVAGVYADSLQVGDWIFHPWLSKPLESFSFYKSIDLAAYTDNLKDHNHIYVLDHRITSLASELKVSSFVIKELLIREAAEYDQYLPALKEAVERLYHCPYEEFIDFIVNNHSFAMPRYLDVHTKEFMAFLVATTQFCSESSVQGVYRLTFRIKDAELLKDLVRFCKNVMNVKYKVQVLDTHTVVEVFNKPLFRFYKQGGLLRVLESLRHADADLQEYFQKFKMYGYSSTSLDIVLALKWYYYQQKVVTSLLEVSGSYSLCIRTDDLDSLDSTLIIDDDGFYSQITEILDKPVREDFSILSQPAYLGLSFTKLSI